MSLLHSGPAWAAFAAALLLAACSDPPSAAGRPGAGAPRGRAAADARLAAPGQPEDMVAAVAAGAGGGPVDIRFRLDQRPAVGQPLNLDVMVTAISPVNSIRVVFQGGEGFEIRAGQQLGPVDHPEVGQGVEHRVTLMPRADGIFHVSAVALVEQATGQEVARTYSIPIIAGAGIDGQAAR